MLTRTAATLTAFVVLSSSYAQGEWRTNANPWGVLAIHMILLPNKSLLIFNRSRPDTGESTFGNNVVSPGTNGYYEDYVSLTPPEINEEERELFCAGHTLDENGNVVIAGGHGATWTAGDGHGIRDVWLLKWNGTYEWQRMQDMANGRWYPTVIQTPDRTFMTLMGTFCSSSSEEALHDCPEHSNNSIVRNRAPDLWTLIPGSTNPVDHMQFLAPRGMDVFYPHMFVQPSTGRLYYAPAGLNQTSQDFTAQAARFNQETLTWESYATVSPTLAKSSTGTSPYVSTSHQVKARLGWVDFGSNDFTIKLDRIEFGVR